MAVGAFGPAVAPPHRFTEVEARHTLTVDLPFLESLAGVELDVSDAEVRLALPGNSSPVCIALPPALHQQALAGPAEAKFSKRRGQLTLSWGSAPTKAAGSQQGVQGAVDADPPDGSAPDRPIGSPAAPGGIQAVAAGDLAAAGAGEGGAAGAAEQLVAAAARQGEALPSPDAAQGSPPAKPQPRAAAYGSVWNANSWHWEDRNCMELARAEVRKALAGCEASALRHVRELGGASMTLRDFEVSGDASISLRKGRRIICFELAVVFGWECKDEFGGPLGAKGTGKATGIMQDGDDDPKVEVKASASSSGGREAKLAAEWMRTKGAEAISQSLRGEVLAAAILAADEAQANPDADRALRDSERRMAEEARLLTGNVQARIAAEQLERERMLQASSENAGAVKGSVWNVNGWHWEEKPMTEWSRTWLLRELEGRQLPLLGGATGVTLSGVSVSGDASLCVRKGKPIVLFALVLSCRWVVSGGLGEARGTLQVPEFSSEDRPGSSAIQVDGPIGSLTAAMRKDGVRGVREVLARFIAALREQLPKAATSPGPSADDAT